MGVDTQANLWDQLSATSRALLSVPEYKGAGASQLRWVGALRLLLHRALPAPSVGTRDNWRGQ
jgi:hypothetical protein